MASPASPGDDKPRLSAKSTLDPVLRNAIRYTISAKEYQTLHKFILSRSKTLKRNTPSVAQVEKLVDKTGRDDYNAAAVRASVRVFVTAAAGLKLLELIKARISKGASRTPQTSLFKSANFRLSVSLSTILLFHRLLFRFFGRLRARLLNPDAAPFIERNPRTSHALTSALAPAIGASLAGFLLGIYPGDQLRTTVAIYAFSRAAEFTYNHAENEGWLWGKPGTRWERPWWFGSWMLASVASGQLLHAFMFDRDCFPASFGDSIMNFSPQYLQRRPENYPSNMSWPGTYEITDNLAEIHKLKFPKFVSPILFPEGQTLPSSLTPIAPITSSAHPTITSLSCALMHPSDPSCLRTYLKYWLSTFPKVARFFAMLFSGLSLLKAKAFYQSPLASLDKLARSVLSMSTFVTGSIGTSWAMICLFQQLLPPTVLPTQRVFLGGAVGGAWAFLERKGGRSKFMYFTRLSIESTCKVGLKRGWWKGVRGGDVAVFVASLAVINAVYTRDAEAVNSSVSRRLISGLRGEGFQDVLSKDKGKDVADGSKME